MKRTSSILAVLLPAAVLLGAAQGTPASAGEGNALFRHVNANCARGMRDLFLLFSPRILALKRDNQSDQDRLTEANKRLCDPGNYTVLVEGAGGGPGGQRPVKVLSVEIQPSPEEPEASAIGVHLQLDQDVTLTGLVQVQPMEGPFWLLGDANAIERIHFSIAQEIDWSVDDNTTYRPATKFSYQFDPLHFGNLLAGDVEQEAYSLHLSSRGAPEAITKGGKMTGWKRSQFDLRVTLPAGIPTDVEGAGGTSEDASGEVADHVTFEYAQLRYGKGQGFSSWGVRVRTTGSFEGVEAVAHGDLHARWLDSRRFFYAASLEAGYRSGKDDWSSETLRVPDVGNWVVRPNLTAEWMPDLGVINSNMGEGLRFFVRTRAYADLFENSAGDNSVRLRPFTDAELFTNISDDWRAFLRYELGYVPPDLSQRTQRLFFGVGSAF